MKPSRHQQSRPALDLIEEAIHLLRTAPGGVVASYFIGTLPFILGLLYFWADMSRSPYARQHVVEAALGVTLLFVWMKFWQTVFARQLRAFAAGETPPPLTARRCYRIAIGQAALQTTGLFLLPLAAIPALPLAWVYAFYQNLTALGDSDARAVRELFRRSAKQARLWPQQNHLVLLILSLFAGFVFLNCCVGCGMLPQLVKMLFGVETVFSRGGLAILNTTFFATMFTLTWLCVDPIIKAVYVLRCFYGDSVQSGADLRAELRQFAQDATRIAACLLAFLVLTHAAPTRAAEEPQTPITTRKTISPDELNRAIDETIQHRKYTWRMPRERVAEAEAAEKGILAGFFESVGKLIRDAIKGTLEWIGNILQKFFRGRSWSPTSGSGSGWAAMLELVLYALVAAVLLAIGFLLVRLWRNRQPKPELVQTEALLPVPDLRDENVSADQLPEDGWIKLARELLARGEFRLALRAYYLSSLAHLAERNLISLARFKSNHEYERELNRRAHSFPNLRQLFGENVNAFDRVWYGTHEASGELVTQFASNVERIKTGA